MIFGDEVCEDRMRFDNDRPPLDTGEEGEPDEAFSLRFLSDEPVDDVLVLIFSRRFLSGEPEWVLVPVVVVVLLLDTAGRSSPPPPRRPGMRGTSAGARGSPVDDNCDDPDPARRLPVRPRSIKPSSGVLLLRLAVDSIILITFSLRGRWGEGGGEHCVPASTTVGRRVMDDDDDNANVTGGDGRGLLTLDVIAGGSRCDDNNDVDEDDEE